MNTWQSIPGETPIDDISGLIPKGITTRSQLNDLEAENIREAVVVYLAAKPTKRQAPFTLNWIYKLHKHMFGDVWTWAGTKRTMEVNIGVSVHQIDEQLQNMLDNLEYWRRTGTMNMLEQSARLHHQAVYIHPFLNGNGRWARLLANIWLMRNDSPITIWPDQAVGNKSIIRDEYLEAIRAADAGNFAPLIGLHHRYSTEI
ncbi:MAG TPA: mobile mystery protein B [Phycisphaerae bacterium]|nr:mobile mystery protein B [Phycisphaerae bacterium]